MPTKGEVTRRSTRDAHDRFELVKDKLLANGAVEADIVPALDAVVTEAALEDGDAAEKFFDCVLLCEVTREATVQARATTRAAGTADKAARAVR